MQMQIEVEQSLSSMQLEAQQQQQQQQQDKNKDVKNINIDSLKYLRDKVESLTVFHQTEVLRILHKNKVTFSENKNGIFVNLTYVNSDVIDAINEYIIYVYKQESQLNEIEEKKIVLSNQYFK
jgi:hypothetical protein